MANRDYFTKPIQGGGREGRDYGHNRIHRNKQRDPWTGPMLIFALFVILYFGSEYLR